MSDAEKTPEPFTERHAIDCALIAAIVSRETALQRVTKNLEKAELRLAQARKHNAPYKRQNGAEKRCQEHREYRDMLVKTLAVYKKILLDRNQKNETLKQVINL